MPLPSVTNGAKQCQVMTKRTKQRCKNPCAFGSEKACRLHGSHKSRNVLRGKNHPNYKHGKRTKEAEADSRKTSIALLRLREIGDQLNMFNGGYSRGRKPNGYIKYDLSRPGDLFVAILETIKRDA